MMEMLLASAVFVAVVLALSVLVLGARAVLLRQTPLRITLNAGKTLSALSGDRLLAVLAREGISLPAACGGVGSCGQCKVLVRQGAGPALETEKARLSRAELRAGLRLACQITLHKDLTLELAPDVLGAQQWLCTVASSRTVAPLIREIVLDLPAGQELSFRPGAFVQVTAPPYALRYAEYEISPPHRAAWEHFALSGLSAHSNAPVQRAYSIANRPSDGMGRIVLLIRLALPPPSQPHAPPGVVSSYLFGLAAGETVELSGPFGSFAAEDGTREMVVIGGGVGMAPLRAILFDQLENKKSNRPISFWYGARSAVDLFYQEEFDALAAQYPNFSWTVALSDPAEDDHWSGERGFIHDVVARLHLDRHPAPQACEYYLCGPPLMIKAVLALLEDRGVPAEQIFNDDFGG